MSVLISPETYIKIIQGDLDWLLKQPRDLERDHIEAILRNIIKRSLSIVVFVEKVKVFMVLLKVRKVVASRKILPTTTLSFSIN